MHVKHQKYWEMIKVIHKEMLTIIKTHFVGAPLYLQPRAKAAESINGFCYCFRHTHLVNGVGLDSYSFNLEYDLK